jgi:hypothetical protein
MKMKKFFLVYCSYPYSDGPITRTEEMKALSQKIYEQTNDLILIIPHLVFDALYDFPPGYTHPEIALAELAIIARCDIFAYDPQNVSIGVNWEKSFAELIQKPVITFEDLLYGERPSINAQSEIRFRRITKTLKSEKGKKFDQGKIMVDLIVPEFIEGLARVLTMGAQKYGLENWKRDLEKRRIIAALYRHLLAYHRGEVHDLESSLNHMLHVAANAMFLYYYDEIPKRLKK